MSTEWVVPKQDLEYALRIIGNVPAKSGMVSSEYIRVFAIGPSTGLALGADLAAEAHLAISFPFDKPLYIDRRLFEPFVTAGKELKSDTYEMVMKKKGILTVKHGNRLAVFSVYKKVSGYSEIPQYKDGAQSMRVYESWTKAMQCAVCCATDDPVAPNLNCVYVVPDGAKALRMYASNIKVVFVGKGTTKKVPNAPIAFPLMLASRLEGNDMEDVIWDDKSALIYSERGFIWQPVKSAARKKFPLKELNALVARMKENKPVLNLAAEDVGVAADRLATYLAAVSREDLILKIKASKDDVRAKLTSGTGDTVFTENLTLLKPARADVNLHWPLDEVLPALEFSKNQGKSEIYIADDGVSMYATEDISLVVAKEAK